ncbi:MAG: radical SAM protein, partial [Zoogloeaceae bacterium]|nr:radical SAM protein [Zoogloeaceae bacterium]
MRYLGPTYHLLAKPAGADCNLACAYCFFLEKEGLFSRRPRMSAEVLESMIRQRLDSLEPEIEIAWQGGEPTLMGLEFFQTAVALVARTRRPGQRVRHSLQTNGILLDDEWCAFLAAHD